VDHRVSPGGIGDCAGAGMAVIHKHGNLIAYLIIVATLAAGLGKLQHDSENAREANTAVATQLLYQNQLDACERGNTIREVVYGNTQSAVKQDPGFGQFEDNLRILQDTPYANLKTGRIDCVAAVPKPKDSE